MRFLAIGLCAAVCTLLAPSAPRAAIDDVRQRALLLYTGAVSPRVIAAFESAERVRVLVAFDRVEIGAAPGPAQRAARRAALATRRDEILGSVPASERSGLRVFETVEAFAVHVTARGLMRLALHPRVRHIDLDGEVRSQLGEAVPLVGLDTLQGYGWDGSGVQVAIIDTGVDLDHPDLVGAIVGERCYCNGGGAGCCPDGSTDQTGPGSAQDDQLHGTFLAGIVTSAGVHAPLGGAPGAEIVAVKVLDATGNGIASDILAGLDWIATQRPDVDVVNLSLGLSNHVGDCDEVDANTMAFASALDGLRAQGIPATVSSGNQGSGTQMNLPACIASALSVGAVWDADEGGLSVLGCTDATTEADQVTCWSNSNSVTDLMAPGGRIESSLLDGTSMQGYGTSLAAPMVAACIAALLHALPGTTPDALETALEGSGPGVTDATNGLMFPRIDCAAALQALGGGAPVPSPSRGWRLLLFGLLAASGLAAVRGLRRRPRSQAAAAGPA